MKALFLALTCAASLTTLADDAVVKLVSKPTGFEPVQLDVPAGKPFVIEVTNAGTKAIEFESKPLRAEKVIPPGQTAKIKVAALKPGSYKFVDEFNEANAKGTVVAK